MFRTPQSEFTSTGYKSDAEMLQENLEQMPNASLEDLRTEVLRIAQYVRENYDPYSPSSWGMVIWLTHVSEEFANRENQQEK